MLISNNQGGLAMVKNKKSFKGKDAEAAKVVYRKGDKYYCTECNSVIEMHGDCPSCHKHIDWDQVKAVMKQF